MREVLIKLGGKQASNDKFKGNRDHNQFNFAA